MTEREKFDDWFNSNNDIGQIVPVAKEDAYKILFPVWQAAILAQEPQEAVGKIPFIENDILRYAEEEQLFLFADADDLLQIANGIIEYVNINFTSPPSQAIQSHSSDAEPVAYGILNTAITGKSHTLMLVRLEIPSDDQYSGALWKPLYLANPDQSVRIAELEKQVKSLQDEDEISNGTCDLLSKVLAEICLTIKGEPPYNTLFSYHDLPKLVSELQATNAKLVERLEEIIKNEEKSNGHYYDDAEWNSCPICKAMYLLKNLALTKEG